MILAGPPLFPRVLPMGGSSHGPQGAPLTGVTVIWASPRFGHPHFQKPSDMGIGLGLQGMPISLGSWEWGCPKRGDAHITVTPGPGLVPMALPLTRSTLSLQGAPPHPVHS